MMNSKLLVKANIKYLPITEEDLKIGMYVSSVGFQSVRSGEEYPPRIGHMANYMFDVSVGRKLYDCALVYVTKGEGYVATSEMSKKKIKKGTLLVLFPNKWHTYYPDSKIGWSEYWVTFKGSVFERYMHFIVDESNPVVELGVNDQLVRFFLEMITISESQNVGFQQTLCGVLLHLLGVAQSIVKNSVYNSKDIEFIQQVRVFMFENIYERIHPEQIAESMNMSYSSFRKFFKQYTGLAPLQYILQLKLEKAKELLLCTNSSIKEISLMLNFESLDYFSSFFRSKIGVSPNEYRNMHKISVNK